MATAEIEFYTVYKRRNSTAGPRYPDEWAFTLQGDFKAPFDILRPVVVVENPDPTTTHWGRSFKIGTPPNYAIIQQIPHVGETQIRAYWISNIIWISDTLVEVHMECDVLATYQGNILNSTQYVLRSSARSDGRIMDDFYPTYGPESSSGVSLNNTIPWHQTTPWLAAGKFVVGIVNDDANAFGGVSYYLFDCISYNYLRKLLLSDVSWTNMQFSDIETSLYKSLFNPMQYIYSVMWFPDGVINTLWTDASNALQHTLHLGWWDDLDISDPQGQSTLGFKFLYNAYDAGTINLSARHHAYATTRGNYLNCPPYFNRILYLPPFDAIQLDTAALYADTDYPVLEWRVDFITGEATIRVKSHAQSDVIVGTGRCQMGVPMLIAQTTQDIIGAFGGVTQLGAGVGMLAAGASMAINGGSGGGAMQTGFSNAITGAKTLTQSIMPQLVSEGMQSSISAFGMDCLDVIVTKFPSPDDNDRFGRPLCQVYKLNELRRNIGDPYGYVLCKNASTPWIGLLSEERTAIENFLNTGVFLETYAATP